MEREVKLIRSIRAAVLLSVLALLCLVLRAVIPGLVPGFDPDLASQRHSAAAYPLAVNVQTQIKPQILKVVIPSDLNGSAISDQEKSLLQEFAGTEGLALEWTRTTDAQELRAQLNSGQIDIIASVNESKAAGLGKDILYTLPWAISKQQVVGRVGSNGKYTLDDLLVRQIALKRSSPSWQVLSDMAEQSLSMEILEIPEPIETEEILKRVSSGQYDLAAVDALSLPRDIGFHYEVEAVLDLTNESLLSWGVSRERESLHRNLNRFLSRKHLETLMAKSYIEDLPQIKQRKLLRLVTYQSPVNYFYEDGRFRGFEYNLINRFAEQHNLRLDVVIAETHDEMLEMLRQGKGDVIAASAPEEQYMDVDNIKLTIPYNHATPVLVGRNDEKLVDIRDLEGRNIHLSPESPYRQVLQRIRRHGINLNIINIDADENTESVLFGVAQGYYDLTVVGSHELASELSRQINLKAQFNLDDPQALVWIVEDKNTQLLSALNEFISIEYRKGFYNVIYSRYIDKPKARKADPRLFAHIDQLSPYDDIVNKYADQYSFDWRLIVAQMYQESRFNPGAVSVAGAKGLMQLLPTTASMIGVKNLDDPENNISGGVRYMNYLRGRLGNNMTVEERTWFTLASYNAGLNRVKQARALAESMNLDKNKWFNNVEIAMLKMATPYLENGKAVRICRCGQTAAYVREIRTLYNNYLRLTQSVRAASRVTQDSAYLDEI